MSSAANHKKRAHRLHGRTVGALGKINRTAGIRGSDTYAGKGLAGVLYLFRRRIVAARDAKKEA